MMMSITGISDNINFAVYRPTDKNVRKPLFVGRFLRFRG